jgi:hypothetical protein
LGAGLPRKQAAVDGSSSSDSELPVVHTQQLLERTHQHQPSPSDRGCVEMSRPNQLVKFGSAEARRFARFGDGTGKTLGEGDYHRCWRVLQGRSLTASPEAVAVLLTLTHFASLSEMGADEAPELDSPWAKSTKIRVSE